MEVSTYGEDEIVVGVEIVDNNGVEHDLQTEFDGEISYHGQDGYPDESANRTDRGNEMVRQARDYAKWYVSQETEHDTCPWYLNCDRMKTVRTVVEELSDEKLKHHFEEYYPQLAGEYDDSITQPHSDPVPAGAAINDYREYKLDIYLTEDDTDIDATSGVHTMYYGGIDDDQLIKTDDPTVGSNTSQLTFRGTNFSRSSAITSGARFGIAISHAARIHPNSTVCSVPVRTI